MAEIEGKAHAKRGTRNVKVGKRSVQIRDQIDIPCGWVPRPDQQPLWDYLEGGGKRAVCVAHRRWGKDDVALHFTATQMIERPGNYWHMLPQYNQARKVIWDALNPKTGRRRVDEAFPQWVRAKDPRAGDVHRVHERRHVAAPGLRPLRQPRRLDPRGHRLLRVCRRRPHGVGVFEADTGGERRAGRSSSIRPGARTTGRASTISRERSTGWFAQLLPADRTPVFTPDRLEQERRELLAEFGETEGEMLFLQEYYCSFEGMEHGAYYAKQLKAARLEGRITAVPHAAGHEVYTFWDLGMDDSTSIWFMQAIGRELRFIDYYEAQGEGLAHYAKVLKEKPYVYGDHYMPHDAEVRELGTGTSRQSNRREPRHKAGDRRAARKRYPGRPFRHRAVPQYHVPVLVRRAQMRPRHRCPRRVPVRVRPGEEEAGRPSAAQLVFSRRAMPSGRSRAVSVRRPKVQRDVYHERDGFGRRW